MARSSGDRPYGRFRPLFPKDVPPGGTPRSPWRARVAELRRRTHGAQLVLAAVVLSVGGSLVVNGLTPAAVRLSQTDVDKSIKDALASATPKPNVAVAAYESIKESVVLVKTRMNDESAAIARGSGFLLDAGGTVVTSHHIVRGAAEIVVVFWDGEETSAAIAESRPDFDIAILDVIGSGRKPAVLASPKSLRVGDEAMVVGSPGGQGGALSVGVISRLGSTIQPSWGGPPIGGLIQFDAVMYPGNTGGPLVNRRGEVIGVVVVPNTTGFMGIGYAVPIDGAASVAGSNPF